MSTEPTLFAASLATGDLAAALAAKFAHILSLLLLCSDLIISFIIKKIK